MSLSNKATVARRSFRSMYNNTTVNIVRDIAAGRKAMDIAKSLKVTTGTVAAVHANLTRGSYSPFAVVDSKHRVLGSAF